MNEYCKHCPRRFDSGLPGLNGACRSDGELDAKILIVGMSPGENELFNTPFIGAAGSTLWWAARGCGFSRADVRLMNVTNCFPIGNHGKTLSEQQIGACWQRFNDEIQQSKATVVVCLGGDALRRVTGLHKIDKYRGFLFSTDQLRAQEVSIPVEGAYKTSRKCDECKGTGIFIPAERTVRGVAIGCILCNGTGWKYRKGDPRLIRSKIEVQPILPPACKWVIGTYHPSYIMRMGRKPMRAFLNDLDRAVRASRGELELKTYRYDVEPRQIGHNGLVAFDIENIGGLDGSIDRIALAGDTDAWTSPWTHSTREAVRFELGDNDRIKVAHNIQHDLKHLEADGVAVPGKIFDTMWAGMVLEPDLPMGLRSMAPLWLDLHGCWKDDMPYAGGNNVERGNALDAIITRDLAKALILRHRDIGSYNALMKWIMPSLRVLLDMHRTGLHVDLQWLGGWSKRLTNRKAVVVSKWEEMAPGVDPASHQQVHSFLHGRLGLEVVKDPDNGFKPTSAAWALKSLIHKYPEYSRLLGCLLTYRKLEKYLDCCGVVLGPDGCVHPSFGPNWKDDPEEDASVRSKRKGTTSTMRLSVAAQGGLNLQQMPHYARRIYTAPPGMVFVAADLDRAEPWVYGVRSNDPALIHELENGDPYLRVAEQAGCSRQAAKILFLARMYGAKERKGKIILAKQGMNVATDTVARVFGAMAQIYSRCERYRFQIGQTAVQKGKLTSGFGFTRNFLGGEADIPEAQDWEAQHHVAMLLWTLFVPLHEMAKSFGGHLALTVYDEAMIVVPEEHAEAAGKAMLEIMRTERPEIAPGFRPRVSEVKVGKNWRDLG